MNVRRILLHSLAAVAVVAPLGVAAAGGAQAAVTCKVNWGWNAEEGAGEAWGSCSGTTLPIRVRATCAKNVNGVIKVTGSDGPWTKGTYIASALCPVGYYVNSAYVQHY